MTNLRTNEPRDDNGNWGRWKIITGIAAAVAAIGIGTPLAANTLRDAPVPRSMSEMVAAETNSDLADITPAVETKPALGILETSPQTGPETDVAETQAPHDDIDEYTYAGEDPAPIASLEIQGDALVTDGQTADVAERAYAIWGRFAELIPAEQRQMLTRFELMSSDYEGAHVYPTEADATKWVLGVAEGLGSDLDMTLIHEWAHLVTLKASEVPPNPNASRCKTYFTGEGCALPDSTVAGFVQAFWSQDTIEEAERIYEILDEDDYFEASNAFLAAHQGEFVSEYAATNPAEDLAETFAVFVLKDRPTGNEIKDLKVLFLWDDANLVTLRGQIRSNL
jgi:hypothetical protein